MSKISLKWAVGCPVVWTAYDNKRCIVRSAPGIWDGTDYVWFISEHNSMDHSFAVREQDFRLLSTEDLRKK